MDRIFILIAINAVFGGIYLLTRWARRNPAELWVIVLYRLAIGPRTDVGNMTRRELFESAASFVTWALVCLNVLLLTGLLGFEKGKESSVAAQAGLFGASLFFGITALAALYLFTRGIFRRTSSGQMRPIHYWIQRADFSATEHEPVEAPDGLHAFQSHDWQQEFDLLSQLESAGRECCPPGIGFVDRDGSILHVCPSADGYATVHYHFTTTRKILGFIPVSGPALQPKQGVHRSEVLGLIGLIYERRKNDLLQRLAAA